MFLASTGFYYSRVNLSKSIFAILQQQMENSPKTLLKVYLVSQTFTGLFFNCVFFQFRSKKILLIGKYLLLLLQIKFSMVKGENSSFDITLMREHLLVCLQLEKISPFPKTSKGFYRCRSILLFFYIYCTCRVAYLSRQY